MEKTYLQSARDHLNPTICEVMSPGAQCGRDLGPTLSFFMEAWQIKLIKEQGQSVDSVLQ